MIKARTSLLLGFAVLASACGSLHAQAGAPVELVETAPVETILDHPKIPEAFRVWPEMIRGARHDLEIAQFYIVSEGADRMRPVLDAIADAARRGVAVRILGDGHFYKTYPDALDTLGALDGVEVRIFDVGAVMGGVLHAKYFIVDGREAYLGSQNFDGRSLEHVQELGLRIRQPAVVRSLVDVFNLDWALAGGEPRPTTRLGAKDHFPVRVTLDGAPAALTPAHSPKGFLPDESLWDLPRLIALIDGAQRRVRVQVLSYETHMYDGTPWAVLDATLRRAAGRGVAVELLVSNWMTRKRRIAAVADLERVPGITVKIATVPEASSGFIPFARVIHSKLMTVDGRVAWVGTSNWSGDYFLKSRNVGLIVESAPFTAQVDDFFETTWDSAYAEELVPGRVYPEPRIGK